MFTNAFILFGGVGTYHTDISSAQVSSVGWNHFDSASVNETTSGNCTPSHNYHAVSFDNKTTWSVYKSSSWIDVVRNNSGTWQYKNAGSWANASSNTQTQALIQATNQSAYQWEKTAIEAMGRDQWEASGGWSGSINTIDWAVTPKNGTDVNADGSQNSSYDYATIQSTDYTTGSQVVSGSAGTGSPFYVWKLFDRNISNNQGYLQTGDNPVIVMVDMGAGNEKAVNKYRYMGSCVGGYQYFAFPSAWLLQGSNNTSVVYNSDKGWTTIHDVSGFSPPYNGGSWSSDITFSNSTAYRYYRWYITTPHLSYSSVCAIQELQLIAAPQTETSPTFTKVTITYEI